MKYFIPQVVVVEVKTDTAKLKSIFEVDTIETGGTFMSEAIINLIKQVNQTRGIILCLDPDTPGEDIRKRLEKHLGKFQEVFVKKPKT
jgi:ribonuclease M5